jgi:hypothetical protein
MRGLTLKVEAHAGQSHEDAASAVVALATDLGLCVESTFNQVVVMAFPGDDPLSLVASFRRAQEAGLRGPVTSTNKATN